VQAVVGQADVVLVQRNLLTPDIWEACDYWRGLGKMVVADLDDDYPNLTPQNPAFNFWILDRAGLKERIGLTPVEALTEGFRHVDALMSPNRLILSDWAARMAETGDELPGYWLPNYANWQWYKSIKQKPPPEPDGPVIVGWGGSVSHWDSWWFSGLREAVPELTAKYPRLMWKVCGGDGRVKKFFDKLAPDRWIDQPGVPPDVWPQQVASFDVGVAPLCGPGYPQGERYDQRRSWLKAVEYLLAGVPWVASGGVVYAELDGKGGFTVENTPEAWFAGLSDMMDNLDERRAESKKLMVWARDNLTMEHVVERYVQVFTDAITDRNAIQKVRLPNVYYSADIFNQVGEIESTEIEIVEEDSEALAAWQRATYWLSTTWHNGLDMDYGGVDLARVLQYPLLQRFNEIVVEGQSND